MGLEFIPRPRAHGPSRMLKFLTALALIWFVWWRLRRFLWHRRLRQQGIEIPEEKGPRPITLMAGMLLAVYGGYMLWHLFSLSASGS